MAAKTPAAPLDRAVEKARSALVAYDACKGYEADEYAMCCIEPFRLLLAALDADKRLEEAGAALREISAECTEPPFMGDGSLVSARRIKGMCDRYFARREEKGENRG